MQGNVHTESKSEQVALPNLFFSFLADEPRLNRNHDLVRFESDRWVASKFDYDEAALKALQKSDCSLLAAMWAPAAGYERYRTVSDWINWIFPFDDLLDEGAEGDTQKAQERINSVLDIMLDDIEYNGVKGPFAELHDCLWGRIVKSSPIGLQHRYAERMRLTWGAALDQVRLEATGRIPSLDEMVELRTWAAAAMPIFTLIEYANELNLPEEIFEHPSIKTLETIGAQFVAITNDIISYSKEKGDDVNHNIVTLHHLSGLSDQEALNKTADMLKPRLQNWYLALADLPHWEGSTGFQVQKYIRGIQDVVLGCLTWCSRSERYLGATHEGYKKFHMLPLKNLMVVDSEELFSKKTKLSIPASKAAANPCNPNSVEAQGYQETHKAVDVGKA